MPRQYRLSIAVSLAFVLAATLFAANRPALAEPTICAVRPHDAYLYAKDRGWKFGCYLGELMADRVGGAISCTGEVSDIVPRLEWLSAFGEGKKLRSHKGVRSKIHGFTVAAVNDWKTCTRSGYELCVKSPSAPGVPYELTLETLEFEINDHDCTEVLRRVFGK